MSLGLADRQGDLLDDVNRFCEDVLPPTSIFGVLARERDRLFPDEMFADLFSARGRRSVPPSVVATVMVLQRLEGLSDREAVERYTFDARWRYAAGAGGYDTGAWGGFAHTVLVDMRARLAASDDPRRIFRVSLDAARSAGLVGAKRVLDSTPLYDAVATMDTVTLLRSAIRGLLRAAEGPLAAELRTMLRRDDDYERPGKPQIDWDDRAARDELVDALAVDAFGVLMLLDGRVLSAPVVEAAALLAAVAGQDLEQTDDGLFRIARRVAPDRVISTVDPQARHGHKTSARGFDGYKGHAAIDPDSEIITDTEVSAGNVGDAAVAEALIDDLLDAGSQEPDTTGQETTGQETTGQETTGEQPEAAQPTVYGDSAYGSGAFLDRLARAGIESRCKTQPPPAPADRFSKDAFTVDLENDAVTCPNEVTVPIRRDRHGDGTAFFAGACADCPLRAQCTASSNGRTIKVGRYEHRLADARRQSKDPDWVADYRATRPKVERKLGHLMFRRHGGRRARMRGRVKIDADFSLLAAAHNLARLGVLGIRSTATGWMVAVA
jgi:hypothetical protein